MIPKLSFPLETLRLTPLYLDTSELAQIKASSLAPAALSKVSAAYHELYFPAPPPDRPYTFASMVLSLDGKMAFPDDPQGPLVASANTLDRNGGLADFWVLNVLRAHADAIIVGAKTLQSEPEVILACLDPDLVTERKSRLGKANEVPLNIVVSLNGTDVPFEHALFSNPDIQTLIATGPHGGHFLQTQFGQNALLVGPFRTFAEVDTAPVSAQVQAGLQAGQKVILMTGDGTPDARVLLYLLRKIGIQHLLLESPTYMWLLMKQHMLDEFFVDYSSLYIGGTLTPGYAQSFSSLEHPHAKFLVIATHQNSFLFTRQKLIYAPTRC